MSVLPSEEQASFPTCLKPLRSKVFSGSPVIFSPVDTAETLSLRLCAPWRLQSGTSVSAGFHRHTQGTIRLGGFLAPKTLAFPSFWEALFLLILLFVLTQ